MSELKKEFRWFNIMEYEKEENYLSKRHQEGWKFKRVTFPGVYTFERSVCLENLVIRNWQQIVSMDLQSKHLGYSRYKFCLCVSKYS